MLGSCLIITQSNNNSWLSGPLIVSLITRLLLRWTEFYYFNCLIKSTTVNRNQIYPSHCSVGTSRSELGSQVIYLCTCNNHVVCKGREKLCVNDKNVCTCLISTFKIRLLASIHWGLIHLDWDLGSILLIMGNQAFSDASALSVFICIYKQKHVREYK